MTKCYAQVVGLCLMIVWLVIPGVARAEPLRDRTGLTVTQKGQGSTAVVKGEGASIRSAAPVQIVPRDPDALKWVLSIAFIVLASSTLILFVLGCGSRVVVFADANDAFRAACIFIAPVVTSVVGLGVAWAFGTDQSQTYPSFLELLKDNPAALFVLGVCALWWAWAILGTVVSSIRYNGLIVGLIVAILKLGAVFSLLVIWWGILNNYNNDSFEQVSAKVFLLGLLAWFGSKFLNGERVMHRRSIMQQRSQMTVEA